MSPVAAKARTSKGLSARNMNTPPAASTIGKGGSGLIKRSRLSTSTTASVTSDPLQLLMDGDEDEIFFGAVTLVEQGKSETLSTRRNTMLFNVR